MGRSSNLPVGRHCDVEADFAICCWVLEKLDSEGKCPVKSLRKAKHIGHSRAVRLIANCMEATLQLELCSLTAKTAKNPSQTAKKARLQPNAAVWLGFAVCFLGCCSQAL